MNLSRRQFLCQTSAALIGARAHAAKDGFRELFDGRTLDGWKAIPRLNIPKGKKWDALSAAELRPALVAAMSQTPEGKRQVEHVGRWEVVDGEIVGGQEPAGSGLGGNLMTEATFSDFELKVDARPDWPVDTGIMFRAHEMGKVKADADMVAFLNLIADQWYGIHREIILQHDPDHLLLGDKNMFNMRYDWVLAALKKHVDVVAIQTYGLWADDVKITDEIYAATGKPLFNGDGCYSFAAPQQKEWGVKGWRTGARSVEEVAKFYRETLEGMMATPYIMGWHHCGYLQQWDAAERGDSPMNENGILDPFETKIKPWTDVIEATNAKAASLHEAALKH